ncbi:hypothetical protein BH24ACI4_BH24ACI4_08070 [soil metagenome]
MNVRVSPFGREAKSVRRRGPVVPFARFLAAMVCVFGAASSAAAQDVVLYSTDASTVRGNWGRVESSSAAGGSKMTSSDYGWSSTDAPYGDPGDYFEATFQAEAWTGYRVWVRMRAAGDSKWNDSVWLQFSDAVNSDGGAVYGIGTGSGLLVNLETCNDCGVGGWGWSGGAWWVTQPTTIQFTSSGSKTVRVQTREDGVEIDQIVLSASSYRYSAPGSPTWDSTHVSEGGGGAVTTVTAAATGAVRSILGIIEAEDFDNGPNGTAYWDNSSGNTGGQYRSTDVDIEACSEGGYNVGWVGSGEWLNYTVNVPSDGTYTLEFRVASPGGGSLGAQFNGSDRTGAIAVPATGGWQSWTTVRKAVDLSAGNQELKVVFDTAGLNLNYINVVEGEGSAPVSASAVGGERLRVMTWNISFGDAGTWAQAQEIANTGADVVLLQEASNFNEDMERTYPDKLRQLTGQNWSAVWASHFGRYSENEGTLILTRLPIVDRSTRRIYDRGFTRVLVDVGGIHVNVLNAHLDWYDTGMRSAQLEDFMWWGSQFSGPRIAGGDFNAWWGEWWIRRMTEEHTDTWVDVTGSNENGYSLNGAVRFDYLFRAHQDGWRLSPTAMWVPWTGLSDHAPVVADYSVR